MRPLFLALLLMLTPAAAEARWREASSRHFVIYSEQSEAELRKFAEKLARFDKTLRVGLRRPDPDRSPATRLTVFVLSSQDRLQRFIDIMYAAGVYYGRASGSVTFTHSEGPRRSGVATDPQIVLFHEYTHHFLFNNFDFGAPLWFSEGYPEFWSSTVIDPDGSVHYGRPSTHRSAELTQLQRIPAERLVNLRMPMPMEAFAATYGLGWVLSHYLTFEPSRAGQLDLYLRRLSEGRSPEEAATAFGDLKQLDRDLRNYLSRSRYSYATLTPDKTAPGPITVRTLGDGEEAIMAVRMKSKRGVNAREAKSLVEPARAVGQRFPNDPVVQATLAEVEYDAGNFDQAEAAAGRALAADPKHTEARLFQARAMAGRLKAAKDKSPEKWREVRRLIGIANRADPGDPEPLVAFFDSFEGAGEAPTANAVDGLIYAQQLASEDRPLRIQVVRQYLLRNDVARARATLSPMSGDSHAGAVGEQLVAIMALLEKGDSRGALEKLDAALASTER